MFPVKFRSTSLVPLVVGRNFRWGLAEIEDENVSGEVPFDFTGPTGWGPNMRKSMEVVISFKMG
jgi:hypothetical protein